MKRSKAGAVILSLIVAGALAMAPQASAGPVGMHGERGGSHGKSVRQGSRDSGSRDFGGHAARNGRSSGRSSGRSDTPVLDALRDAGRRSGGKSDTPILDGLRGLRDDYRDRYDYDRHHDNEAKYYRDAAIANAVVGLVGIAVSAATQPRVYAEPAPVAYCEPRGHYRTERVLVERGHYEQVRVWIPDSVDHCGRVIPGYYELRQRWVPDVFEYRPVWVAE